jgi:hypothetical protein
VEASVSLVFVQFTQAAEEGVVAGIHFDPIYGFNVDPANSISNPTLVVWTGQQPYRTLGANVLEERVTAESRHPSATETQACLFNRLKL